MERPTAIVEGASPRWFIAHRWQEFEGEGRACLIRLVLVILFYGSQLLHHWLWSEGLEVDRLFHRQATWISALWLLLSLSIVVCLKRGFFPRWLKYLATLLDLILLTLLASLGSGPSSPLVLIYFLLIVLSLLRFSVRLNWFTTLGAVVGYMILVGKTDPVWFDPDHSTKPIVQVVTLLTILATGFGCDQVLRSIDRFADAIEKVAIQRKATNEKTEQIGRE